jgi:hypothetical protein
MQMVIDVVIHQFHCCSIIVDIVIIVPFIVGWRRITFARAFTAADFTRVRYPWQIRATDDQRPLLPLCRMNDCVNDSSVWI